MNINRQWGDYIEDISDAVQSIEEFVSDMTYEEFISDKKTYFAVIRCIEIIGEATKNILDPEREKYPDIPWKDMAGMRDKVIHHYFGVDLKVVWKTIKEDIPSIQPKISEILNDIDKDKGEAETAAESPED